MRWQLKMRMVLLPGSIKRSFDLIVTELRRRVNNKVKACRMEGTTVVFAHNIVGKSMLDAQIQPVCVSSL